MPSRFKKLSDWYFRSERWLSSIGLVSGFLFDIFTLTRVDKLLENIWVGFHLIVAAVGILFLNLYEEGKLKAKVPGRAHFWWTFVIQFAFGGLFSVYLVFYSRSTNLFASWPFLLVLAINFLANERLRERYARAGFQMTMLFLGILFYNIYIIPIILKSISITIFILSSLASLIVMIIFLLIIWRLSPEHIRKERWILLGGIGGSFLIINILYFAHLIPPIPLALKDASVYHSVSRDQASGTYIALDEYSGNPKWYQYFLSKETIHLAYGEPAYVYTAVFSPNGFSTNIVHRWQYFDTRQKKWQTVSVIPLLVRGGRDNGFRTYSLKGNLVAGEWRVNVETTNGAVIGRLNFDVEPVATAPILKEVTL